MSAFGLVTGGVLYWLKRVVQGLMHIYGQARSHSISTDTPRVHGSEKDQSAAVCRCGTRFGNKGEENGRGRAKVVGFPSPPLLRWPCFIHVPLMTFPEEVSCGTPHPHSSILSISDVQVIDRRTVVNVITRGRRLPYVVDVNGPWMTAALIKGNGKSVRTKANCHFEHLTLAY